MSGACGNARRGPVPAGGAADVRRLVVLDFSKVLRTPNTDQPCRGNVAPPSVDTPDGVQKRKSAGGDASAPPAGLADARTHSFDLLPLTSGAFWGAAPTRRPLPRVHEHPVRHPGQTSPRTVPPRRSALAVERWT